MRSDGLFDTLFTTAEVAGLTQAEIEEVLMHTAIYAGVPAANRAFAVAREVFAQLEEA